MFTVDCEELQHITDITLTKLHRQTVFKATNLRLNIICILVGYISTVRISNASLVWINFLNTFPKQTRGI